MTYKIRMLLAETLLGWCLSLAPEGTRLSKMIKYYFTVVAEDTGGE